MAYQTVRLVLSADARRPVVSHTVVRNLVSLAGYVFSAHGPTRFVFHAESHTVAVHGDFLAVGVFAVFPGPSESADAQVFYG